MRIILRGNRNKRVISRTQNPTYEQEQTLREEEIKETVSNTVRPFVVEQTPTKIVVKKTQSSTKTEHLVELDELTVVTQSLMDLCKEVLKD